MRLFRSKESLSANMVPQLDLINNGESNQLEKTETEQRVNNCCRFKEKEGSYDETENEQSIEDAAGSSKSSPALPAGIRITTEQRRMHYVFREYDAVARNPIEGIYVTPGADSPLIWFGLLIVRTGIFYGGIFRFTLTMPDDFPDSENVPTVQFEEPLFHPLVNPKTNCVDLSRHFPSGWQRDRNHIYQVIIATQGIFFSCHCDSAQAANPEAAILLKENRKKFIQLAHDAVRQSRTQVYAMPASNDPNAISFSPWNETDMEPWRQYLLGRGLLPVGDAKQQAKGHSWLNVEKLRFMCDPETQCGTSENCTFSSDS